MKEDKARLQEIALIFNESAPIDSFTLVFPSRQWIIKGKIGQPFCIDLHER